MKNICEKNNNIKRPKHASRTMDTIKAICPSGLRRLHQHLQLRYKNIFEQGKTKIKGFCGTCPVLIKLLLMKT